MFPKNCRYELKERNDVKRSYLTPRGLAVEKEIEQLKADRMALNVQSINILVAA